MSEETAGKAVALSMGMGASGKEVFVQRETDKGKVKKAISRLKCGKDADLDGIT